MKKHERCTVPGCGRTHHAKGLCTAHWIRHMRGKPLDAPLRKWTRAGHPCAVAGCRHLSLAKGLCNAHRQRKAKGRPDWDGPLTRVLDGHVRVRAGVIRKELAEMLDARARALRTNRTVVLEAIIQAAFYNPMKREAA